MPMPLRHHDFSRLQYINTLPEPPLPPRLLLRLRAYHTVCCHHAFTLFITPLRHYYFIYYYLPCRIRHAFAAPYIIIIVICYYCIHNILLLLPRRHYIYIATYAILRGLRHWLRVICRLRHKVMSPIVVMPSPSCGTVVAANAHIIAAGFRRRVLMAAALFTITPLCLIVTPFLNIGYYCFGDIVYLPARRLVMVAHRSAHAVTAQYRYQWRCRLRRQELLRHSHAAMPFIAVNITTPYIWPSRLPLSLRCLLRATL